MVQYESTGECESVHWILKGRSKVAVAGETASGELYFVVQKITKRQRWLIGVG